MLERISRRDFLIACGILGATDITMALGITYRDEVLVAYRYLDAYIRGEKPKPLSPLAEIESNIIFDESLQNGDIVANKQAFVLAAVVTAMHKDPQMGLYNLQSFLRNFPLRILAEKKDIEVTLDSTGAKAETFAQYTSIISGGPEIIFYPAYLNHYRRGLRENDPQIQIESDAAIYHEYTHLMQEATHPLTFVSHENSENYDYLKDPLEIEAFDLSRTIVMEEFQKVYEANFYYWPLGKFFEFKDNRHYDPDKLKPSQ